MNKDRLFWIWLSRRLGPGCRHYMALLERFHTPYEVFEASEDSLVEVCPELTARDLAALADKNLDEAYEIVGYCSRNGISLLCYDDPRYPLTYRSLVDPPLLLYYRGKLPDFQTKLHIAVVGTRKMSEYGRRTAYKIAYELAAAGTVIVSGMALGIDSVAACAALEAGGTTVAILGSGIDVPYPTEHAKFQEIIESRGVVMTEFAPGVRPLGHHFPMRNRLISGLAQGTLIVDADEGSGALITADRALAQGRALYAVPANIGDRNASGTNRLIREGAHVVLAAEDILNEYKLLYRGAIRFGQSATLGRKSDYNGEALARMGVYSRTVGGNSRIPAQSGIDTSDAPSAPTAPTRAPTPIRKAKAPVKEEQVAPTATVTADRSAELLATMGEREKRVFEAIPMDNPIAIDRLLSTGYGMGELLAALSLLEIKGLIQTLPGGLYCRA
ncbi:MAG: DNA-processing protein DprA [Clostridia bacterium]|nr:DNA-processing protein DprA [Clostridia bacterium]